ncbi:ATP-binding protein [Novosphingobium sp. BL-8A]|uniref:sensor histidine kinase n=1 Tax=Novosphingobium sp. BL-8A TaxID=3127639 RepID=UPI0037571BB6
MSDLPVGDDGKAMAIAHELRQPLFAIAIATERLRLLLTETGQRDACTGAALARIAMQTEWAQRVIARTLGHPDGDAPLGEKPADLAAAVRNSAGLLDEVAASAGVSFQLPSDVRPVCVALQAVALEQVFVNVLRNGIEAIQSRRDRGWTGRGTILVELACDGRYARVIVTDNGSGFIDETADAPCSGRKRGFGLGLAICRDILAPVGGALRLGPGKDGGAVAEIVVPLAEQPERSDIVAA